MHRSQRISAKADRIVLPYIKEKCRIFLLPAIRRNGVLSRISGAVCSGTECIDGLSEEGVTFMDGYGCDHCMYHVSAGSRYGRSDPYEDLV